MAARRTGSRRNDSRRAACSRSVDLAIDDFIGDVRPTFVDLEDDIDLEPVGAQVNRRAARGDQLETGLQGRGRCDQFALSSLLTLTNAVPLSGNR